MATGIAYGIFAYFILWPWNTFLLKRHAKNVQEQNGGSYVQFIKNNIKANKEFKGNRIYWGISVFLLLIWMLISFIIPIYLVGFVVYGHKFIS
jgi:hypothetical protein